MSAASGGGGASNKYTVSGGGVDDANVDPAAAKAEANTDDANNTTYSGASAAGDASPSPQLVARELARQRAERLKVWASISQSEHCLLYTSPSPRDRG